MARMFTATVQDGAIADRELAALPNGARVTVVIEDGDDRGELDADTEAALAARIEEADRGDSFVDAADVLRDLDERAARGA